MPRARALQPSVVIAVLFTAALLGSAQVIHKDSPECNGVFDFYFVLDSSGSVSDSFHSEIVPFVENVTDHYIDPDFRVAFVTFANEAVVHLNLTRIGDREEILAGIGRLKNFTANGGTNLAPGLTEVNDQITRLGGDAASVVLVLTDGVLGDLRSAQIQAGLAQSKGASVFAIGVENSNVEQLTQIAGSVSRTFNGSNFEYLSQVIDRVVNETCIEIGSVSPSHACVGSSQNLTLSGRGFTNQLVPDRAGCRFMTQDGELYSTQLVGMVTYNVMSCPVPRLNNTGSVLLQVTMNGISFISSNVTMEVISCQPTNASGVAIGVFAGLLTLLAVILIALLWFFCPLITGKVVRELPPEKPKLPPRPPPFKGTPGRKWEVVDASYYGGRGAGGITPMTVRWGEKGATLEGNKLEKAKDAAVVKVVERKPSRPAPPRPRPPKPVDPGCWALFKAKVARCYAVAASYRPVYTVHGPARKILWTQLAQTEARNRSTAQTRRESFSKRDSVKSMTTAPVRSAPPPPTKRESFKRDSVKSISTATEKRDSKV